MLPYPKIQSVYLRDPLTKFRTFLDGQYSTEAIRYLARNQWIWTEKIDGTNIRIHWDGERVTFSGRTERSQMPVFLFYILQDMFPVEKFQAFIGTPVTLYGEGYGAKIQKGGGYIPDGQSFILFDVLINDHWQEYSNVVSIAEQMEIDSVPIHNIGTIKAAIQVLSRGACPRSLIANCEIEGFVLRPEVELMDRLGERVITKIKRRDFPAERD